MTPAVTPTPPVFVAFLRGLLYAALAAVVAVIIALTPADITALGPAGPLVVWGARIAEAWLFDRNQPAQAGRLGGRPA